MSSSLPSLGKHLPIFPLGEGLLHSGNESHGLFKHFRLLLKNLALSRTQSCGINSKFSREKALC